MICLHLQSFLFIRVGDGEYADNCLSTCRSAEVHAALAAAIYRHKPAQLARAEQEWDVCQEFDRRFGDVEWVRRSKRWPPAMLTALSSFLALQ